MVFGKRVAWPVFLLFASGLASVTVVALAPAGSESGAHFVDLLNPLPAFLGALLCWQSAATAADGRVRLGWRLVALALLSSAAAELIWGYLDIAGISAAFPLADILWAALYPLVLVALLLLIPAERDALGGVTASLDAALLTLAAVGLSWPALIGPTLAAGTGGPDLLLSMSWVAGDILLLFALASLMLRRAPGRTGAHWLWLALAIALNVAGDFGYGLLTLNDSYHAGQPLDLLWVASYIAFGLAAVRARRDAATGKTSADIEQDWARRARLALPYLTLPAAAVLVGSTIAANRAGRPPATAELVILVLMLGAVLVRQAFALLDSYRLGRSLSRLSADLQVSVAQRTEQLAALTALSECTASAEVIGEMFRALERVLRLRGGMLWLLEPEGTATRRASHRLGLAEEALAETAPRALIARGEAFPPPGPAVVRNSDLASALPDAGAVKPFDLLLVPMVSRRDCIGVLGLIAQDGRSWTAADMDMASAMAAPCGVALDNALRYERTAHIADSDPVTDLLNYRAIHQAVEREIKRATRTGHGFAIVMMDLDGFKLVNDRDGHFAGDGALRRVAACLTAAKRDYDVVGRYGGDEFLAILPECDPAGATAYAQRVQAALRPDAAAGVQATQASQAGIDFSFGVAGYPRDARTVSALITHADAQLLLAKQPELREREAALPAASPGSVAGSSYAVLDALVSVIDKQDNYTRRHSEQVAEIALAIAVELGFSGASQRAIRIAGLFHDVGKIGLSWEALNAAGGPGGQNGEDVQEHAALGALIAGQVPNLPDVAAAIATHHEHYDGTGYPAGLAGEQIPLAGRILAVADALARRTGLLVGGEATGQLEGARSLRLTAGTVLDSSVVEALIRAAGREAAGRGK